MPVVVAFIVSAALVLLETWVAMLLLGALHAEVSGFPSFGFPASLTLVILVNVLLIPATSGRER